MTTPRCLWTQDNFPAYKAGKLDRDQADLLFAHLMYCDGCRGALWQPEVDRFRASLKGGAWLADKAVSWRTERYGVIPMALAASAKGSRARVGHARGIALLGDARDERVDVFCHATLVGGTPGTMKVRMPPALRLGGMSNPFKPVEEALLRLLPRSLPPVAVEVALDAAGPLPHQLLLAGDSLQLPVAISAASAWLDLAVRTDRIFTGALRGDGLLLEVGDLDEKVYLTPPGSRLVVPARGGISAAFSGQVLVAADLVQALDHAGATLPVGGVMSLAAAGATGEAAAARATLERIPQAGIVLAFPPDNPTGASLWYVSSRAGLVAFIPGDDAAAAEAVAAVRRGAEHLREVGALARDRVPFPLRGFALAPEDGAGGGAEVLAARTWMDASALAARVQAPIEGRGLLPFATALTVAEALWAWGGGDPAAWERSLPTEPPPAVRTPGLKLGKVRRLLRTGAGPDTRLPEPGQARWCDPDFTLPMKDLTRHLFIAGSPSDGAGDLLRGLVEGAVRHDLPAVVLDLDGGLASMAIPATRAGLGAVSERLPGSEAWLKARVDGRKPWPGETREEIAPVPVRLTFAPVDAQGRGGHPPEDGLSPELWVIDAHRRPRAAQSQLLDAWATALSRASAHTVHPGRPNALLAISAGSALAPDGSEKTRRAVERLLRAGPQVGVAVAIAVRAPGDLHPSLAAQCHAGLIGSPGGAGAWPGLPASWSELAPLVSRLGAHDLLLRTPDTLAVVQPRLATSLPLPDAPVDLLERFAIAVEGTRDAPISQATVLPDMDVAEDELVEAGILLPRVPFQRHVLGYRVALGAGGEVGGDPDGVLGALEVRREDGSYRITLVAEQEGIALDGQGLAPGKAIALMGEHVITVAGRALRYSYQARRAEPAGWPYVAEIQGIAPHRWPLTGELRIGRDRALCQVALADRKTQADLIWSRSDTPPAGAEGITLDAIYASGLHGEIACAEDATTLTNRSSRTDIYVRRAGQLETVAAGGPGHPLRPGDEILIGQRVFRWDRS